MNETQHQLARRINRLVRRAGLGGDEHLLAAMADHMHLFKQLLDSSTEAEMDELAQTYPAFGGVCPRTRPPGEETGGAKAAREMNELHRNLICRVATATKSTSSKQH